MGFDLTTLRSEIRNIVGMDSSDLPDTDVNLQMNMTWWELQDKINFREKEGSGNVLVFAGIREYAIFDTNSALESLTHVTITPATGHGTQDVALKKIDYINGMEEVDYATTARGMPTEYARYGGSIYFFPLPDQQYTVNLAYRKLLDDVSITGLLIPQAWHEFILLGACRRIFRRNGEYQKAAAIRADSDALTLTNIEKETKEKIDYHFAGIQVMRARYP
jgi:hypothetical protein